MAKKKKNNGSSYRVANPELAKGLRDIAFGNKAGTHDNRPNRQRTRKAIKENAIRNGER
jgi:hypothetical protein